MKNIPEMLYIETTNICNANCIFCAYQYDKRQKGTIDFNLFKKIVFEYKKVGGKKISLSPFAGEVFVDPNILKKINFLKQQNFDLVYTYTNALLFHKFNINDILTSGLTSLNISIGTPKKSIYTKIYRNHNYEQLLKNLENLLKHFNLNKEKTIKHIYLEFRSDRSMEEIEKLSDFKEYILPYLNSNITVGAMQIFDSWMGQINQDDLLTGMYIKNANFEKKTPCSRLSMLQVLANGDTRICGCRYNNNAKEDIFNIGNANDENIITMYNKKKVIDIKNSFYNDDIPLECQLCSWYTGDSSWVNTK